MAAMAISDALSQEIKGLALKVCDAEQRAATAEAKLQALEFREAARLAAARAGLEELAVNEASRLVSFVTAEGVKIHVYYTSRTVATCLTHPQQGKTQLFRRDVDLELLKQLFRNPRQHTGRGYHRCQPEARAATFYPSLSGIVWVKVGGCLVAASHDLGTACVEKRSFIDLAFVASLPDGEQLLASLVQPVPACTSLDGTKTSGEVVLGMLPDKLNISVVMSGKETGLMLALDRALVVDKLPVPLHISVKCVHTSKMSKRETDIYNMAFACTGHDWDSKFSVQNFPTSYQDHAYWKNDGILYLGAGLEDIAQLMMSKTRVVPQRVALLGSAWRPGDWSSWSEGCDVLAQVPADGLDPEVYGTVATFENEFPSSSRALSEFYEGGGRVVVFPAGGRFDFIKDTIKPLFNVNWSFRSYTRHEFVLTEAGARIVGGVPGELSGEIFPYEKGYFLEVPEGESILLPRHDFKHDYGYDPDDTNHECYDAEEVEAWRENRPRDTPIAFHESEAHGGQLAFVGFNHWKGHPEYSQITERLIRRGLSLDDPPYIEGRPQQVN